MNHEVPAEEMSAQEGTRDEARRHTGRGHLAILGNGLQVPALQAGGLQER